MQAVHVDFSDVAQAADSAGRIMDVRVVAAHPNSLAAVPAVRRGEAA